MEMIGERCIEKIRALFGDFPPEITEQYIALRRQFPEGFSSEPLSRGLQFMDGMNSIAERLKRDFVFSEEKKQWLSS